MSVDNFISSGNPLDALEVVARRGTRRLSLRYHPLRRCCVLTVPPRTPKREVERFLRTHGGKMEAYLCTLPEPVALTHSAVVPVLGVLHELVARGHAGSGCYPVLEVPGQGDRVAVLARRALERIARAHITQQLERLLALPELATAGAVSDVRLRDTVSRWGSCAHDGRMMFSWRLVFAPRHVFDYVITHECVHLLHRNHGAGFRRLLHRLYPEATQAERWLRERGSSLFRYG